MNRISILIAILFLAACQSSEDGQHTDAESEVVNTLQVDDLLKSNPNIKIGPLETRTIEREIKCTGRIEIPPSEFISVHAKTVGFIEDINYLPGDFVKKGARLFSISNPELIEKQRLFSEAKAELDQVNREYERQRQLNEVQATSLKRFEETGSQRQLLRARYEGLKSELMLIGVNVESLIEKQAYQSQVGIYAIASGYVHEVMVNKGQMIRPEDVLMEMANDDHVHLELQVLSKDASRITVDQKVTFQIPQDRTVYSANVIKVNHMLDERTSTLKVHCHISEDHIQNIKVGMMVQAQIASSPSEVVGLPLSAVIKEGEIYYGYVIQDGQLIKQVLEDVTLHNDFVSFNLDQGTEMVIEGAYYIQ